MDRPPLALHAPAKVNLTLEVLGRRPDGYHEIRSVMQAITLADRLRITLTGDLSLRCDRPELAGPDNLVWRAAERLRREAPAAGGPRGAAIALEKRIPIAAGLGGGSSDAAAALLGLNTLWDLRLPRARLREIGAELGSDVPFFLGESATALVAGRGERLTPLVPLPDRWLVLVKPPLGLSAASVYGAFPAARWRDGARTAAWLDAAAASSAVPAPFNDLEPVALSLAPPAAAARAALLDAGAPDALLSGSGPTCFSLFDAEGAARVVYLRLRAAGHETYLAQFASALASD